jgi:ABC-type nickel/cobalt efflux system permease component RcnA
MIVRHASLIIAIVLVALVATACIVRTSRPPGHHHRAQPAHVEKHKKVKHKKVKHRKHR